MTTNTHVDEATRAPTDRGMKPALLLAALGLLVVTGCYERHEASLDPSYTGEGKSRAVVPPIAPASGERWYACVAGDTLSSVAKRNAMTVQELIERNNLKDSPGLTPGQQLVVRAGATK